MEKICHSEEMNVGRGRQMKVEDIYTYQQSDTKQYAKISTGKTSKIVCLNAIHELYMQYV